MSADFSNADERRDAYDALVQPELFEGVRTRRMFAFLIDAIAVAILFLPAAVLVFFLGIFTLGLGWLLFAVLSPILPIAYTAFTLGGPNAATPGMRAMGLEMRLWYGARPYPLLAAVHVILFWFSISLLTPLILLISLFSDRKRLLHDIVLGTLVMNSEALRR
ncbi:RDD family protein [Roseibium polysiphoniae]|uniref:RDD family protein n=1 Tax=Roseibium polysiphoniae TaxID=2571221 RepID=A0ABR9C5F2_9HYPH|nr:RDD family protein [Roseibium polysiphoniae]MBD8875065.1 RDD family protein [Roseibium polysiphoniae]